MKAAMMNCNKTTALAGTRIVPENVTGVRTTRTWPALGCGMLCTILRCATCACSSNTERNELMGAHGKSRPPPRARIQASVVRRANSRCNMGTSTGDVVAAEYIQKK